MPFYKIKSGRVNGVTTATDYTGEIGHLFYDLVDYTLRVSDGVTPGGIPLTGSGGHTTSTFSVATTSTPPTSPVIGDIWWDTEDGRGYIYFEDTWVDLNPPGRQVAISGSAPVTANSTGTAGQLAYDANYIYVCVDTNTWKRSPLSSWAPPPP